MSDTKDSETIAPYSLGNDTKRSVVNEAHR